MLWACVTCVTPILLKDQTRILHDVRQQPVRRASCPEWAAVIKCMPRRPRCWVTRLQSRHCWRGEHHWASWMTAAIGANLQENNNSMHST